MYNERKAVSLLELLVVIAIIAMVIALTVSGVQSVRATSARAVCLNQMRQQAIACQNYAITHGSFPPGCRSDDSKQKYPFLSWQATILPQLDHSELWSEVVTAYQIERDFRKSPPHRIKEISLRIFLVHPIPMS
jgi:prepilin-type N-terminal cleavage/methylation domain-containing protein